MFGLQELGSILSSFVLSLEPRVSTMEHEAVGYSDPVTPSPEQIISPLSTDPMVHADEVKQEEERGLALTPFLDYVSSLVYLSFFGILGVVTRYKLQKLFGPNVSGVTSDHTPLYLDLPSNMVGSFLMGWFGAVFKNDIANKSTHLAVGLTTGYLGSLTTFSGWNQKMLDLSVGGHWVLSAVGFLLGLFLAAYSIKFGIGTAKICKSFVSSQSWDRCHYQSHWRLNTIKLHFLVTTALALALISAWIFCLILLIQKEFHKHNSTSQLYLACVVAPVGVWTRWRLAIRYNGRGFGKAGALKWMKLGTLLANVSAACIMAFLAGLKKAVHTDKCNTVASGIQLGFLGCLSTVSTFISEYNAMEDSEQYRRAYVYAWTTILVSFGLGMLFYHVPLWVKGHG